MGDTWDTSETATSQQRDNSYAAAEQHRAVPNRVTVQANSDKATKPPGHRTTQQRCSYDTGTKAMKQQRNSNETSSRQQRTTSKHRRNISETEGEQQQHSNDTAAKQQLNNSQHARKPRNGNENVKLTSNVAAAKRYALTYSNQSCTYM